MAFPQVARSTAVPPWDEAFELLASIADAKTAALQADRLVLGIRRMTGARAVLLRASGPTAHLQTPIAAAGFAPSPLGEIRVPLSGDAGPVLHIWPGPHGLERNLLALAEAVALPAGQLLAKSETMSQLTARSELATRMQQQLIQAQKLDSLGAMAGAVAHDFNNLLAAIMGFAAILRESRNLDADDLDSLEMVEEAGHRAAELTGRLLSFARGGLTEFKPVDLCEVVATTVKLCGATVRRQVLLVLELPEHAAMVEGDANQLQQAVLNIILNANEALTAHGAKDGAITVTVRTDVIGVHCTIADNGPGMDESVVRRIFEPFFTTKTGTGTGLGLAITYGIIQNHKGSLSVRSQPGAGAEFAIRLPRTGPTVS
jgi:signal transduction histidine kinase